jgi:hypothetical protein
MMKKNPLNTAMGLSLATSILSMGVCVSVITDKSYPFFVYLAISALIVYNTLRSK